MQYGINDIVADESPLPSQTRFGVNDTARAGASLAQAGRRRAVELACQRHERTSNLHVYKPRAKGGAAQDEQTVNARCMIERERGLDLGDFVSLAEMTSLILFLN